MDLVVNFQRSALTYCSQKGRMTTCFYSVEQTVMCHFEQIPPCKIIAKPLCAARFATGEQKSQELK